MHSNEHREKALQLRLRGRSYNEIAQVLPVPKSTLRSWLGRIVLSDAAQRRLSERMKSGSVVLIRRNKMQTHLARQRAQRIRASAARRISNAPEDAISLIGALLYWAEGYKRPMMRSGREVTAHSISFLNSDAGMARLFVKFLQGGLGIDPREIVLAMRLYPHINENTAREYWMQATGLSKSNFRRSTYLVSSASKRKRPFNRLPYGTLQVAVYRTDKFYELMGMVDGVKRMFGCDTLS